jgi:hypothetical protein
MSRSTKNMTYKDNSTWSSEIVANSYNVSWLNQTLFSCLQAGRRGARPARLGIVPDHINGSGTVIVILPDILIRRTLDTPTNILPIEIKYIRKQHQPKPLQRRLVNLSFTVWYILSLLSLWLLNHSLNGKVQIDLSIQANEEKLRGKLAEWIDSS